MGYWLAFTGGKADQPESSVGLDALISLHFHMMMKPFLVPALRMRFFGLKLIVLILSLNSWP